jgi:hypothetical protein
MRGVRGASKQPGEIRRSQNWFGGTHPGNAVFVPAPSEELPALLADFEKYFHTGDRIGINEVNESGNPTSIQRICIRPRSAGSQVGHSEECRQNHGSDRQAQRPDHAAMVNHITHGARTDDRA